GTGGRLRQLPGDFVAALIPTSTYQPTLAPVRNGSYAPFFAPFALLCAFARNPSLRETRLCVKSP
ncbi:MAG TPA: hypothetical protein VF646_08340, partial [Cytophagales bacterium]